VQPHPRLFPKLDIRNPEIGDFVNPRRGVVQEEQDRAIAESKASVLGKLSEELSNRIPVEKSCLRWRDAFERNPGHLLSHRQTLRNTAGEEVQKRM